MANKGLKLLIGAGGIYVSFLSYGKLHEQIFKYQSADGEKFTYAFFLQALGKWAPSLNEWPFLYRRIGHLVNHV